MALGAASVALRQGMRLLHRCGSVALGALVFGLVVILVTRLTRGRGGVGGERRRFPVTVDAVLFGVDGVQEVDRATPRLVIVNLDGEDSPQRLCEILGLMAHAAVVGGRGAMVADVAAAWLLERQTAMPFIGNVAGETFQGFMAIVGEGICRGPFQERGGRSREDVALAAPRFIDVWR